MARMSASYGIGHRYADHSPVNFCRDAELRSARYFIEAFIHTTLRP
ncbi:hypothetical protein OH687_02430 [Burkholderia anthina]|nr:hypothetical protein OH687_02430 [Burkholderia anthina]